MTKHLPRFIAPMLCKPGEPFDSDEHLFEIKWDGTRTLAFVEGGGYRLVNRREIDMTERYPEFAFLAKLPAGIVLDGEVVVLKQGKPDFASLMSREQARTPLRIRTLARGTPATYIVFDLLYEDFRSLLPRTLVERRERLTDIVRVAGQSSFILSEGIVGRGKAFYDEVCRQDLEGVIAKRLASKYESGRRSGAWTKIKRRAEILCAIIGFLPDGNDFRSLVLAAEVDGKLRYVGKVGTGFNVVVRKKLNALLREQPRKKPIVPCPVRGKWLEPGLFCRVSYLEMSENGELRMPVFEKLETRNQKPD